jgi:hypothetical protein
MTFVTDTIPPQMSEGVNPSLMEFDYGGKEVGQAFQPDRAKGLDVAAARVTLRARP